jgi:hypothetical protein
VFFCLRPPLHTYFILIHTGKGVRGGRVEPERRLEGQQFTKLGKKYQNMLEISIPYPSFQLPRHILRMASNLEVVSMAADIGQLQSSCTFFRLSDRMLKGRVRNFVIWQELAEFQAAAWFLVAAWIWAISWHGGPVQTAGTVQERATHKSRAAWAFSSLGDCIRDSSHLRGSERELISQTRRKSAAGDSADPKQ